MTWLHTWSGLTLGWVLFFVFATGTAGYFDTEIDRWMSPELPAAQSLPASQALDTATRTLQQNAPGAERWFIGLPGSRNDPWLRVFWTKDPQSGNGNRRLDAHTGEILTARATEGGQLLYRMHWRLHYFEDHVGEWIVGIASMFMLVATITGIIVHKKIFADFFTFRPGKGQRSWLDAHNVLGVLALPFHLMITYSGLIFLVITLMPLVMAATYGTSEGDQRRYYDELRGRESRIERSGTQAPLTPLQPLLAQAESRWGEGHVRNIEVLQPNDANARIRIQQRDAGPLRSAEGMVFDGVRGELIEVQPAVRSTPKAVNDVLLGLHEGLFAGTGLRWLYFFSGLLGTAMTATGLVLWTVKRRQRLEKKREVSQRGLRLVERLNVGTIAGLPIAIAAYFWANRLLPLDLADRSAWEANVMFIVWGLLFLHAIMRPAARAWSAQWSLAAAAWALLPLLNAFTTDRHLGVSLGQGDWVMAGMDLGFLGFGLLFAILAYKTHKPVSRPLPFAAAERSVQP